MRTVNVISPPYFEDWKFNERLKTCKISVNLLEIIRQQKNDLLFHDLRIYHLLRHLNVIPDGLQAEYGQFPYPTDS